MNQALATCPCRWCAKPTTFLGTRECNFCHELRTRVYNHPEMAEKMLQAHHASSLDTRKGEWLQTYSGRQFWPLDPRPEEVFIEDVAHALSLLCRYGGHCEGFYSVAQHSYYVSNEVAVPALALEGLLHDAEEAYCADLITPIKRYLPEYRVMAGKIREAIAERFGLAEEEPPLVKSADTRVMLAEKRQLLKLPPKEWENGAGETGALIRIAAWSPVTAEEVFLARFRELYHG